MKRFSLFLIASLCLCSLAHSQVVTFVPAKPHKDSMRWVYAGLAVQLAGNAADIATSYRQPEATAWLATDGRFQAKGLGIKISLSGGVSAATLLVSRKWPSLRKYAFAFNSALGAGWAGTAVHNLVLNPALR
jgi:hypothetical protein